MTNFIIKTKRLGLRYLEYTDVDYLVPLEADPEVKRYFPSGIRNREETVIMIDKFMKIFQEFGLAGFMIFDLQTNEFIGRAGFGFAEKGEVEVGYLLHKKFWGKGIGTELLQTLLSWAQTHLLCDEIIAYADVENIASTKIMEKCGMQYYKTEITKGLPCHFYLIKNRI